MESEILTVDISQVLPDVGLQKSIQEIWQQDFFLDFTIEVEDEEFKVHKVIMASVSHYFLAMLTGGMLESKTDRVKLHGLNSLAVSNIIEYIYTNEIKSTKANAAEILACAVYLQIPSAIKAATKLLRYQVDKTNCFDILCTFRTYSLKDASTYTEEYIKSNFDEIMKVYNFDNMSHESFLTLIQLWERSEWDLFLTIKDWVETDLETRQQHLDELMTKIRFTLMTPAQVGQIKEMEMYSSYKGSWCEHVEESLKYLDGPMYLKVVDDRLPEAKVRGDPVPVCFAVDDAYNTNMYRLENDKTWGEDIDIPTMPELPNGSAAVVAINNFLVVCGHYSGTQKWHIFDTRTLTWSPMPSMRTPRVNFAVVHGYWCLYAVGGQISLGTNSEIVTDSIEKFDFFTNMWSDLPMKLPTPLHKHCACNAFGALYVTGGWETTERVGDCSTRLVSFKMGMKEGPWRSRAPMLQAFPCLTMRLMQLDNQKVIVVMNEHFLMQYYHPQTDQWSVWDCKPLMYHKMVWCEHGALLADEVNNCLYFLNCQREEDNGSDSDDGSDSDNSSDSDDDSYESGYCVKWKLSIDNRHFTELELPDVPRVECEDEPDVRNYIAALLAIQPPSVMSETSSAAET